MTLVFEKVPEGADCSAGDYDSLKVAQSLPVSPKVPALRAASPESTGTSEYVLPKCEYNTT